MLNTSFNVMGEPFVESPIDAIHCFFSTGLDYLVLGDHLLGKRALQETPDATSKSRSTTSKR
jgi:carbamoyltransferase